MGLIDLLIAIGIGGAAGWLAGQLMKGKDFGVVMNIVIGIIGGVVGKFLFGLVNWSTGNTWVGSLIVSFLGAIFLLWLFGKVQKTSKR